MSTFFDGLSQRMLKHIQFLSEEIGPRGSTSEGEKQGAEYVREQMKDMGITPLWEEFRSARSIFTPHLMGSFLFLVAFFLYLFGGNWGAWVATGVAVIALTSELLELGFQPNLFRWLAPKAKSQNVIAVLPPQGEHRQDLVLIGHIDTQRTPLIFKTHHWVEIYKKFTTIAFVFFTLQVALSLLGALFQWTWIGYALIPSAICAILLGAICIQADLTPYTKGANDNASAVSMVLEFARLFKQNPLEHTRVYCAATGCEEVQHFGAIDFFKRHRQEMVKPVGIVIEMVGCAGPAWCTREGIVVPFYADKRLVRLAEEINQRHPDWQGYPVTINGGNSEMADCIRSKVPSITLFGLTRDGAAPYWHQVGDTIDKINPTILQRFFILAYEMIIELDQKV